MSTRPMLLLSLMSIMLVLGVSLVLWPRLPDPIASHWNATGEVNGYMPRVWGVVLMPLLMLGMLGLFLLLPQIDPLRENLQPFRPVYNLFIFFLILFLCYIDLLTLLWNVGYQLAMDRALPPAISLLFLSIAYMLRHAPRNWFIGIRTPWTLSSDRVWEKTHRLGAVLFVLCGLLSLVAGFFGGLLAIGLILIPLLLIVVFLTIYSWWLYSHQAE